MPTNVCRYIKSLIILNKMSRVRGIDSNNGLTIMAPAYKLTYSDLRGIAEVTRLLFKYGSIEFEDIRIKLEDWPKFKEKTPFGQLPVLKHDEKKSNQSIAIARYVAKQVNLVGKDDWENLEIDAVVDTLNDFRIKFSAIHWEQDQEKKKTLKEQALKEIFPFYLGRLEEITQKNDGHLATGKLTWADFYLAGLAPNITVFAGEEWLKKYPNLKVLIDKVHNLQGVKQWVAARPDSVY